MEIKEGQVVYCTVKQIQGTTVFLDLEEGKEGTMTFSEVSAGRIRNIRDFVFPGKKIICKILKINSSGEIHLSLRRVTSKEKAETLQKHTKEKNLSKIFKLNVKENSEDILNKIKDENNGLIDFFEKAKLSPGILEKYISKEESKKILKILQEKKDKPKEIDKKFFLQCKNEEGIISLKKILEGFEEIIVYLSPGKFRIKKSGKDYKEINKEIDTILETIEKRAKQEKAVFRKEEK